MAYIALREELRRSITSAQTLSLYRAVGNRSGEARALTNLGSVYIELGEKQKALDYFVQALPLSRSVESKWRGENPRKVNVTL